MKGSAEARTRRLVAGARAILAGATSVAGATVVLGACSTSSAVPTDAYADGGVCARERLDLDAGDDADAGCESFFLRPCGFPPSASRATLPNCQFNFNDCEALCGGPYFTCFAFGASCQPDGAIVDDDQLVVECGSCLGLAGRRPAGLVAFGSRKKEHSAIGAHLATMAYLEAASVHAFRKLQRELIEHGAPTALIVAAQRAERDEVRHARTTRRLARSYGATPPRVRLRRDSQRSLEALAIENAIEGCVRETMGALIATWQGERASEPRLRATMKRIAIDELSHATLAWSVDAWSAQLLDREARERVKAAKNKAIGDLRHALQTDPDRDLAEHVGLPEAREQLRLLALVEAELLRGPRAVHAA